MKDARHFHSAVVLNRGDVLVAGGWRSNRRADSLATSEIYDPATQSWIRSAPMQYPRAAHAALVLHNGAVLVIGGIGLGRALSETEIYEPEDQ